MGVSIQSLGLRERKKIQTRENIQRVAFKLFDDKGYANTTVEEIAEAAEVSPSTFFRYFPSKELVLMADDLDQVTVEALARQPADLPTLQAFRRAFDITMAQCRRTSGNWNAPGSGWCSRHPNSSFSSSMCTAGSLGNSRRPRVAGPDATQTTSRCGSFSGHLPGH
jgi:AcrR family transcriptional regulator